MDLSLIIPIYKGSAYAAQSAHLVHDYLSKNPNLSFEVIFVDDGSGDNTKAEPLNSTTDLKSNCS